VAKNSAIIFAACLCNFSQRINNFNTFFNTVIIKKKYKQAVAGVSNLAL